MNFMAQQSPITVLEQAVKKLSDIVDVLRQLGILILSATIVNFTLSVAAALSRDYESRSTISGQVSKSVVTLTQSSSILSFFDLLIGLLALFSIINFESSRKQGNFLFDEISDEVQWLPENGQSYQSVPDRRPNLEIRVTLRSFAQRSDLPLIPGKFGPVWYSIINISLMVMAWLPPL